MIDYDAPATFRGQLQRGRGEAVRRAPHEPGAADAVYECVIRDSRWDWQVDERAGYLAGLIRQLDLPLMPIERHLATCEGEDAQDIDLALQVLAVLPLAGRRDAAAILRRYAREGKHWHAALNAITAAGAFKLPGIWDGLADDIVAGHDEDSIRAVARHGSEPWTTWAQIRPGIRRILDDDKIPERPFHDPRAENRRRRQKLTEIPTQELTRVLSVGGPERRYALEELGRRREPLILDLAEDPGMRNAAGWIPGMSQALHHLGPVAVPRARTWATGGTGLAELGLRVLSEYGDRDDIPTLLEALRRAIDEENWCLAEIPAQGLGNVRAGDAVAEDLAAAWEMTAHSPAREDFLRALGDCAPGKAALFAEEGLSDCEQSVQQLACAGAADNDMVRSRLGELADDPLLPEIHDAAKARLTALRKGSS